MVRRVLAYAATLLTVQLCASPLQGQQVKIMQWNVEGNNGQGLGRKSNNGNAQTMADARIVNYNQPDILLFNEIDASNQTAAVGEAAIVDWVTNNVPYLGTQLGVTFFVKASSSSDGHIRNAAVSRYPIFAEGTYTSAQMLRGLHAFRVQLAGTNVLQVFHAHFKCCNDGSDPGSCGERQTNAVFASTTIRNWAATNSLPYIFAGDWNEDESNPQCSLGGGYRPITMILTNGNLVEFRPTALNGSYRTESTPAPNIRFDYCLAGSNRLSAVSGYVFNSTVWAQQGLYTNASPQNLAGDSTTASDHCSVFVNYSFPVGATNFSVIPGTGFTSGGPAGGPFSPPSQVYTLTNSDTIPLFWSVTKTSNWVTVTPLATNLTLGAGRSTNITVSINSAANLLTPNTYTDTINFSNTATGVLISRGVTLTVNSTPYAADFSGSPTNGLSPLVVTFTDSSTGNISSRSWDFGDGGTTNVTTNVVTYTFMSGTGLVTNYTVTLVVSGVGGADTNSKPNYIKVQASPSTVYIEAGNLQDGSGTLAPINSIAVLVADTGTNGFVDLQPSFSLSLGATWGTDDKVIGLWDLSACACGDGILLDQTTVAYTNGIAPGQKLQLYWFPSLTLASNVLGVTQYGKYTDTNSPPLDGSNPWQMPPGGSSVQLEFLTAVQFGSNPETAGRATLLTSAPLTAFESWQVLHFGSTTDPAAAPGADPDGDGQSNLAEFLAGTDPRDSSSALRITSVVKQGNDILVGWTTPSGRTNALQFTAGSAGGSYSNNFSDLFVVTNVLGAVTNHLDSGAATNIPSRFYRVRLVP